MVSRLAAPRWRLPRGLAVILCTLPVAFPLAAKPLPPAPIVVPDRNQGTTEGPGRTITTADLAAIRDIATMSVSPDGTKFAILVRQADPVENTHRSAWFTGALAGGDLTYVGDGGEGRILVHAQGYVGGTLGGSVSRWSPDGKWIAYTLQRDGEVQLWKSRVDGGAQYQVSHNAANVREFAWSDDGDVLYFSAGSTRAELQARDDAQFRNGIPLEEFNYLFRAVNPGVPDRPLETDLAVWRVGADGHHERIANEEERHAYERAQSRNFTMRPGGVELDPNRLSGAVAPPVLRPSDGAPVWMAKSRPEQEGALPEVRLMASLSQDGADPIVCEASACTGQFFHKVWWSEDGREVLFWRADSEFLTSEHEIHAWAPSTGQVRTILDGTDAALSDCHLFGNDIVCLRETGLRPAHLVAIDAASGDARTVVDVNPEFDHFRFGAIERIEWDLPLDIAGDEYGAKAMGYVLYPPDYDPDRKYPVFLSPYTTGGFHRGDLGDEHPLLVYAANDIVVVDAAFPSPLKIFAESTSDLRETNRRAYDPEKNFPHMSMYVASSLLALDAAAERANIDLTQVGIGGVSHGAFIPLFMMQKHDRLTALSIGGGGWSQFEYHFSKLPPVTEEHPEIGDWPESLEFWEQIDIADHIDTIEAPVLIHFADRELISGVRLVRRMRDAKLPVDAYSFLNEYHTKFHPAHRMAIYTRNLDWFRFWLQDAEDPAESKAAQYEHWRLLREQQCRNPRSLRDYCKVESVFSPPATETSSRLSR